MSDLRELLGFLDGDFSGSETNHASAWAPASVESARVSAHFEDGLDVLVQRQEQAGGFTALNVFTAAGDDIVLYSFDSVGYLPDPPARGGFVDGSLVLLRTTERGSARTTFTSVEGGYRWSKEFQAPGSSEWSMIVDGELNRL